MTTYTTATTFANATCRAGNLPWFLDFTALLAMGHSIVCYLTQPSNSLTVFSGAPPTSQTTLLAHVYGVKNIYSSLIRFYAAADLRHCASANRALYDLATATYAIVLFLFITEMFVWKTVRGREAVWPFFNAGVGLGWMVWERGWYLGA